MSKSNVNVAESVATTEINPLLSVPSQTPNVPVSEPKTKKTSRIERDGLVLQPLMDEYKTKSSVIRYLNSKGYTRGEISEFMGIIYQHVRNVLVQDALKAQAKTQTAAS